MRRYSIGEVCELLDTRAHTLRYWEQEVPIIRPRKDESGRRVYRESDVQQLFRLKYLINERGMTLRGAGRRLVEDAQSGVADRKAVVRQLRSSMLAIADHSRRLRSRLAQAAEAPYVIRERSDATEVLRRWKELPGEARTRFLHELLSFPDYWVEHVRRLTGPGKLFRTPREGVHSRNAPVPLRTLENEDADAFSEGMTAIKTRSLAVLWWPPEDYPAPGELPFRVDEGLVFVAPPVGSFESWQRASGRWVSSAAVRLAPRYPVPLLNRDGSISVTDEGHIQRSDSRLAAATLWLTQPHRRARFMSEGISSVGLLMPGGGLTINASDAARHRRAHASLTVRLLRTETGTKIKGPVWLDLGFLAGLARAGENDTIVSNTHDGGPIRPHVTLGMLVDHAALPLLLQD